MFKVEDFTNEYKTIVRTKQNIFDILKAFYSSDFSYKIQRFEQQNTKSSVKTKLEELYNYNTYILKMRNLEVLGAVERAREVYSLIENVLRNTILYPFIPAYQAINIQCNRYRSNVDEHAQRLMNKLGFRMIDEKFFVYREENSTDTLLLALIITDLWRRLEFHWIPMAYWIKWFCPDCFHENWNFENYFWLENADWKRFWKVSIIILDKFF